MNNHRNSNHKLFIGLVVLLLVSGIGLVGCTGTETEDDVSKLVPTYAAQTLQAISLDQTLTAYQTAIAQVTQAPEETSAPETGGEPEESTEVVPTATPTVQTSPCNWAEYILDISIPDYTTLEPETPFTKTWRIKNIGSCTWTTDYDLVFVNGKSMDAATRIGLPASVSPGQTIDLSVLMNAPGVDGSYAGYWMLADESGNKFGIGPNADGYFWVKITVDSPPKVVYDLAEEYCSARWYSTATKPGSLPCPGDDSDDATGFVIYDSTPRREGGGEENEHGLILSPDNTSDGRISGFFPAFKVQKGDVFKAVIGCAYGSTNCDLRIDLIVQLEPDVNLSLDSWFEVNDGKIRSVSVDLSELAGEEVNIIIRVRNNGTAEDNEALIIYPRIIRE